MVDILNVKNYKKYLNEITQIYNLQESEVRGIFLQSVAKAYEALGAYIWNDGTITVAQKNKKRREEIEVKDYVVSQRIYTKIVEHFIESVNEYSNVRDELDFALKLEREIIEVKVIKEMKDYYLCEPILEVGSVRNYRYILKKKKMFFGEKFKKNEVIKVASGELNNGREIAVERLNKTLCEMIFKEEFRELNRVLEEVYFYRNLSVSFSRSNFDTKSEVIFWVNFGAVPNLYFRQVLLKRLKDRVKRCKIVLKEKGE